MARFTVKSRSRIVARFSMKEMNTLTIALARLSIPDMEDECKEQGLDFSQVEYDHLTLFKQFTDVTNLYPQKQLETPKGEDSLEDENR